MNNGAVKANPLNIKPAGQGHIFRLTSIYRLSGEDLACLLNWRQAPTLEETEHRYLIAFEIIPCSVGWEYVCFWQWEDPLRALQVTPEPR